MSTLNVQIEAAVAAIDFMETHLGEAIDIADAARVAGYSLFHFCRTFNRLAHQPPYGYLMRRRLAEAARELMQGERKVIEIALDYQFQNPETFSRAFKRAFGMQPNQCRRPGIIGARKLMPRLSAAHLRHFSQSDGLMPALAEMRELRLEGLTAVGAGLEPSGVDLWPALAGALGARRLRRDPEDYYGVTSYLDGTPAGGWVYFLGRRLGEVETAMPALAEKMLPAGPYARFIHRGRRAGMKLTRDFIYHSWLSQSGRELPWPMEIECLGSDPIADSADREIAVCLPLCAAGR